ncbi:serine/threonine protein kinase [Bremerella cremea]|uniref:Serine/threonine protein kinase n=1 Tax=Bremerella cremea TaxID=1031537 RepID=A0A368KQ36_9BACT|nr:serine/threonine-protein kinase [Bremerella cremea]RCS47783.1 serine/threonine protein kinase [Bremerella cremea]
MTEKKMGPYRLEATIGSGGMGTVYRGIDERTGDKAAIKVLPSGMSQNEGLRERFQREIETLLQLRHPNIVRLYGFGEEEGELFYAMELVDGKSLAEVIVKNPIKNWRTAVRYSLEIAFGLRQAHDMGIVHRDIKPANILVTKNDKIKILDFGIARLFGATGVTMAGGIVGTADYMAPEQAFGEGVTPKADLYSLGAVLYAMLARQPPFRGSTVAEILDKLRYSEPIPIDRLVETIPNDLAQLVMQLLEKNPDKRVPTARVLCRRLEALLEMPEDTDFEMNLADHSTRVPSSPADEYQLKSSDDAPTLEPNARQLAEAPTMNLAGDEPSAASAPLGKGGQTEAPATIVTNRSDDKDSPKTRFTTVAEQRKKKSEEENRREKSSAWVNYLQIGGLLVALGVVVAVMLIAPRKPDADMLYHTIETSVKDGNLGAVDSQMDDFLDRFPEDSRSEYVAELKEELNLRRREKQYQMTAMLGSSRKQLHPVEQLYLEALKTYDTDPYATRRKLQGILMTYGPIDSQQGDIARCLTLAERRLKQLNGVLAAQTNQQAASIRERLDYAKRIAPDDPARARQIYQGVLQLLSDRTWGSNLSAEAEAGLESLRR